MPRTSPPYPPEFRQEAVRLARSGNISIAQIARDLGIADQTLRTSGEMMTSNSDLLVLCLTCCA